MVQQFMAQDIKANEDQLHLNLGLTFIKARLSNYS